MNVTPKGKIGRLGTALREDVNRRFGDGQKAAKVAAWLNSLTGPVGGMQALDAWFEMLAK